MSKRTVRRARTETAAAAPEPAVSTISNAELDEIFASIRSGAAPWRLEELPADTGATTVLLSELDRLWQNPLN